MDAVARLLGGPDPPTLDVAQRCGIEQEFYVFRDGRQVDFREIIHTLAVAGARIDPGDRNAYRLHDGTLFTADGTEAEFATIPVETVPGFASGLSSLSAQTYDQMATLLPSDLSLRGAATHINVSVPPSMADRLVVEYARTFGPTLQVLWDRPWGEGLMIRPRPGRIEFGGEFIAGPRLAAVALFCCASVQALAAGVRGLPRYDLKLRPATERLGIELRRSTYAEGMYTLGRSAILRAGGRAIPLQATLERSWAAAREYARHHAPVGEIDLLDCMVRGELPLGIEPGVLPEMLSEGQRLVRQWQATPLDGWAGPDGLVVRPRFDTWDTTLFEFNRAGEGWYLVVPRSRMGEFIALAVDGRLGEIPVERTRRLTRHGEVYRPGVFARIADVSVLVPAERAPGSGWNVDGPPPSGETRTGQARGSTQPQAEQPHPRTDRPAKWDTPLGTATGIPAATIPAAVPATTTGIIGGGVPWRPVIIALGVLILILVAVVTVIALGGGDDGGSGADTAETPPGGAGEESPSAIATSGGGVAPVPTPTATPTGPGTGANTPATTEGGGVAVTPAPTATQPGVSGSTPTATNTSGAAVSPTATATTLVAATPTPTPTPVPNAAPVVNSITVTLIAPVTTYTITTSDAENDPRTYAWQITGEACGTPPSPGSLGGGASVPWSHSTAAPDLCAHQGTDHGVTVTVTVFERGIARWICVIQGSNPQTLGQGACQKQGD